METAGKSEPEVVCWRDSALDGACLASARYGKHKFDRHLHDELVIVMTQANAAAAVGFYDQSHLNRLFKRAYGITPGTYAALKPGH